MAIKAFVLPRQKCAKSRSAMAVACFLFRRQFREGLANFREVKQRIVPEAVRSASRTEDDAFGLTVKGRQRMPIARRQQSRNKVTSTEFVRHLVQLAQKTCIVGLIIGVAGLHREIAFSSSIAGRMHAGGSS